MNVAHIVGARPQFIKAAMVSRALRRAGVNEVLIHTGQHYDDTMSAVFFAELGLPRPDFHFTVESGSPSAQTGEMVASIEECLGDIKPDLVLVHGDTNSTLAGALAATKLGIPLAHNEAGLRSYNRTMPEEHNRVITDHCSSLLFCPTQGAHTKLMNEGLQDRSVHVTGDVMYDAALHYASDAEQRSEVSIPSTEFALLTVHRAYTVDNRERLLLLLSVIQDLDIPIVFPAHPRTQHALATFGVNLPANVTMIDPVGYFDMLALEQRASWVLTDSGGVQKEAYFFGVPCITLRPETEWTEIVDAGWNIVTDIDLKTIRDTMDGFDRSLPRPPLFGNGDAAGQIVNIIANTHFHQHE